jgi:hypothetical protein
VIACALPFHRVRVPRTDLGMIAKSRCAKACGIPAFFLEKSSSCAESANTFHDKP